MSFSNIFEQIRETETRADDTKEWLKNFCEQKNIKLLPNDNIKGTVLQIEWALINDGLSASKVSWKFHIPTIYNFAVIQPWNLL